jgi:tetratricopeptide (TPR) repeat protein
VEFNEPIPYQPLLDALQSHVDAKDFAGAAESAAYLLSTLADAASTGPQAAQGDGLAGSHGKLQLFSWLLRRIREIAEQRPLLLVIEDLQWADVGTVDFLAYLLERAKGMRIAIVLTSRTATPNVACSHAVDRVSRYCLEVCNLGPLAEHETAELVRLLLVVEAPSDLFRWVHSETEGNPFFIIETIRLYCQKHEVFDSGSIRTTETVGPTGAVADLGIPAAVKAAVRQRLQLLDKSSIRIARLASALGRSFSDDTLAELSRLPPRRLSSCLDVLVAAGIFEPDKAGYRFSHDKVRAVCYEDLPVATRRSYHRRLAEILSPRVDVPTQQLAWHQHMAGLWRLASRSWALAGDEAREVYAYEDALRAYRLAVSALQRDSSQGVPDRDGQEIRLLVKCDEVLTTLGRPGERKSTLHRVAALCRRTRSPLLEADWLIREALLEEHQANFPNAVRLARRAWRVAASAADSQKESEALRVLAWTLGRSGRHVRAIAVARLALRKLGKQPSLLRSALLEELASVYIKLSNYDAAVSTIQASKANLVDLGYNEERPQALVTEAVILRWKGDLEGARGNLTRAAKLAEQSGDRILTGRVAFQIASINALESKLGDSLRMLRKANLACRTAGYNRTYVSCLNEVANGVGRLIGSYEWATIAADRAHRLARSSGSNLLAAICRDSQAQLLYDQGRLRDALAVVEEVLNLLELGRGSFGPNQESLARRGAILLGLGRLREAIVDLEAAARIQTEKGDRLILVDTLTYLAVAYAGAGRLQAALDTSQQAVRLLEEIGCANSQPQRTYWHHYLLLREVREGDPDAYLRKSVESIERQASSLSPAQAKRLKSRIRLNREILAEWSRTTTPQALEAETARGGAACETRERAVQ